MMRKIAITVTIGVLMGLSVIYSKISAAEPVSRYEDVFDFGSISLDTEIIHVFTISNKGNDTLHIGNARSSCDNVQTLSYYVQILSYPQEIPPHENGQLEIRMVPSEQGEAACEILLETHNSAKAVLAYELKGKIKGKATHQEKSLGKDGKQSPIPAQLLTRRLKKRNPSLLISPKSVWQKIKEKQPVALIDVRDSQEFEKFRIPGSLNIPLFAINTKTFLKSRHLVLINEGYSYSQLEQECKRLRDSGFTAVSILDGGLQHWKKRGGPLEGDIFARQELNKIPSWIFFEERNYDDWIMIDISASEKSEARYLLPQSISIPFSGDVDEFVSQCKAVIDKYKSQSSTPISILIFNEQGEQYEKIEKLIQRAGIEHTYYLKGGLEEYKTFLQQQALIRQPKSKVKTGGSKCGSCS